MIIPKLYGRLGNQCFQVAAAIAHAKKMKTSWAIPRASIDPRTWPNYFLKQVPREHVSIYSCRNLHKEKSHLYEPLPPYADLVIDGYFQTEKYWPEYEQKFAIGNALGFHCNKQDYIAIHVRRGDYVSHFSDKWPPLESLYYMEAFKILHEQMGYDNFKVYSDDIGFCKRQFTDYCGLHFSYSTIKDPLTDMRDMYNAAGFVIANSTFSLFPALLRLDNPVVIAPAEHRWFGPANNIVPDDLMPERFIKI